MCLEDYQKSANVHNYIKKELKKNILKPGVSLHEITRFIEDTIKEKMDYDPNCPLKAGIAFNGQRGSIKELLITHYHYMLKNIYYKRKIY